MISVEEFVRRHLEQHGKTSYTLEEVERLVIEYRKEAAVKSDQEIDQLMFGEVKA